MSYYNEEHDLMFKKCFSSSYVNFKDEEINELAVDILCQSVGEVSATEKVVLDNIVNDIFDNFRNYKSSYCIYFKSSKLLRLFSSSFAISELDDFENKKRAAYLSSRNGFYEKEIQRYSKYENIPLEFARIALNRNCIKYIVGFFLKSHLKSSFTKIIADNLKVNSNEWLANRDLKTPYERVGELQNFIYNLCIEFNGKGSETNIPSKLMRIILSTARLHLSYMDEKNLLLNDLRIVLEKQEDASCKEASSGYKEFSKNAKVANFLDKKYIPNWRQRHLMPFFIESEDLDYIADLSAADKFIDTKLLLVHSGLISSYDISNYKW